MNVKEYIAANGKIPFHVWLNRLDSSIKYRVQARILKLREEGHFGFGKRLAQNLYELKFHKLGGGIRLYYGIDNDEIIILLCGGNKRSQIKDIKLAKKYWESYQKENSGE